MTGNPSNKFVIEQRRQKVLNLISEGMNEIQIAETLSVSQSTISRDANSLKREANQWIYELAKNELPFEFQRIMTGQYQVIRYCWSVIHNSEGTYTNKDKINCAKLVKDTYISIMETINNGPNIFLTRDLEAKVQSWSGGNNHQKVENYILTQEEVSAINKRDEER